MRNLCLGVGLLLAASCEDPSQPVSLDAEAATALDDVLEQAVADSRLPGVVALVTNRDRVLYHAAFGVMDESGQEAMREDAVFQIFSMTKPITSVGLMMLVEEGLIGLDDSASVYLPELADREVLVDISPSSAAVTTRPAARPVTVRDLLRHTSGIGYAERSW